MGAVCLSVLTASVQECGPMCLKRVLARNALAVRKRPARETTLERPSGAFGLSVDTPLRLLYFHLLAFFSLPKTWTLSVLTEGTQTRLQYVLQLNGDDETL